MLATHDDTMQSKTAACVLFLYTSGVCCVGFMLFNLMVIWEVWASLCPALFSPV